MTNKKLVGVRDPFGIRPLVIGKLKQSYIFASETCALDIVGANFVREVENGEIVVVEGDNLKASNLFPNKGETMYFEYIYFARPDSIISGKCAYEFRKSLGFRIRHNETDLEADFVIPVPDSGVPAALGFAERSKKI